MGILEIFWLMVKICIAFSMLIAVLAILSLPVAVFGLIGIFWFMVKICIAFFILIAVLAILNGVVSALWPIGIFVISILHLLLSCIQELFLAVYHPIIDINKRLFYRYFPTRLIRIVILMLNQKKLLKFVMYSFAIAYITIGYILLSRLPSPSVPESYQWTTFFIIIFLFILSYKIHILKNKNDSYSKR